MLLIYSGLHLLLPLMLLIGRQPQPTCTCSEFNFVYNLTTLCNALSIYTCELDQLHVLVVIVSIVAAVYFSSQKSALIGVNS